MADAAARDAVLRGQDRSRKGTGSLSGDVSVAWLKEVRTKNAVREWRKEILARGMGRGAFALPREGVKPRIPRPLQRAPKGLASHLFQMALGHAMIAPFLREKFGWVESDSCW